MCSTRGHHGLHGSQDVDQTIRIEVVHVRYHLQMVHSAPHVVIRMSQINNTEQEFLVVKVSVLKNVYLVVRIINNLRYNISMLTLLCCV